ncbi:MAG: HAD-IA family hydrolase [Streptomyces sp.]
MRRGCGWPLRRLDIVGGGHRLQWRIDPVRGEQVEQQLAPLDVGTGPDVPVRRVASRSKTAYVAGSRAARARARSTVEAARACAVIGGYRIVAPLGEGGMGRVRLARSVSGRLAAIKTVHEHLAAEPEFRERFRRETVAARRSVPVAVASNAPRAVLDATRAAIGLSGLLPVTIAADEVDAPKPAPDLYLAACRLLDAAPADALAFEGSLTGLRAAHRAGLTTLAVTAIPGTITTWTVR